MNTYFNPAKEQEKVVNISYVLYKLVKKDWVKLMSDKEQISQMEAKARERMKERGVEVSDIAELVFFLQKKYHPDLTMDECTLM